MSWSIQIEGLGKKYRRGEAHPLSINFRETLTHFAKAAVTRLNPFRFQNPESRIQNPESVSSEFWALRDINLQIRPGEVMGVIGRNGAGKSTLLKILSRIVPPTCGTVRYRGRMASLLEVGTGFHRELTGRENVYLNGSILGMRRTEITRKLDEIVAFAGIGDFLDTPVKFYSSGMSVRLAFAVAAHLDPDILVVDEVLAVGDIEFQKKCIGQMEKVADEGRTVLVVSHNMRTIKALCSRAVLLDHGEIKAIGAIDAIVDEYLGVNQVDAAEKVIDDHEHDPGGGKSIRVKRIKLVKGLPNKFSVYWKQPICITLDIHVFLHVEDVSFGAGVRLSDGTFVLVVYSDDEARSKWVFSPGNYRIKLTIQNPLRPGIYTLHIGAHQTCAKSRNLFALDAVNLEVVDFTENGRVAAVSNPGFITGVKSDFSFQRSDEKQARE